LPNNFNYALKKLPRIYVSLLDSYCENKKLEEISTSEGIDPNETVVLVRKAIKDISVAISLKEDNQIKKVLAISESDLNTFNETANILYRLKILRKITEVDMEYMADLLEVTRQTYSEYEEGIKTIENKHVEELIIFYEWGYYDFTQAKVEEYKEWCREEKGICDYKDFSTVLPDCEYYELLSSQEKKVLENASAKRDKDIDGQIVMYLYVLGYLAKLSIEEADKRKILKNKDTPPKDVKKLKKRIRILRNMKLYAEDLRQFIYSNLNDSNFKVDLYYINELLFLPRLKLNQKILKSITEYIKNNL